MNTVIKVSNLHKTFKNGETEVHVLKGLDFNVEAGSYFYHGSVRMWKVNTSIFVRRIRLPNKGPNIY